MNKNINKTKILGLLLAIVVVIVGIALFASSEVPVEKKVRTNLHKIDKSISKSIEQELELAPGSNPYDYVEDNEYYKSIIELGVEALAELEKTLANSEANGLKEYILAIAIEEITHANLNGILEEEYAWENAKEFIDEWIDIKGNINKDVLEIATSSELTGLEKSKKLENYGILAVPTIKESNNAGTICNFDNEVSELVDSYELTENDLTILKDYLK